MGNKGVFAQGSEKLESYSQENPALKPTQRANLFQTFLFTYVTCICAASYKSVSWAAAYFSWPFLNSLFFGVNNLIQENGWQNWWINGNVLVSKQLKKRGKEGCHSWVLPKEVNLRISIYESGNRLREMAEAFTRNLHHFNCSKIRLGTAMRKIWCKEYSCTYGGRASPMVSRFHPRVISKIYINVSFWSSVWLTSPRQPSFTMYFLTWFQMRLLVSKLPPVACSNLS